MVSDFISIDPETTLLFFVTLIFLLSIRKKIKYLMYIEIIIKVMIVLLIAWFFALLTPALQNNWFFPILDFGMKFLLQLLVYAFRFLSGYGV